MEHPFNKVVDLLFLARQEGVEVLVKDDRLQLKMEEDKEIGEQLLSEIKSNRQLIIDYLTSDEWKTLTLNHHHNKITPFDRRTLPHVPASFSQERMWFIDHLGGSTEYNLPAVLRLKGHLNKEALLAALQAIIERHEVLRTVFYEMDGGVYQSVKDADSWAIQISDLYANAENGNDINLSSFITTDVKKPFDLSKDFPIRATLITLGNREYILVVTMHHIASDAWSTGIIVNEVARLYNAYLNGTNHILEPLPLQYADFAVWQRNYLQGAVLHEKITYWKNKLEGGETLQLPTNYTRSATRNTRGATVNFTVDNSITEKLHALCLQQGVTLFMLLLAAYKVLLYRYSGQRDITVGTSIASRRQRELEGMVGLFVNTLALRDTIDPTALFTTLLQQVRTTTLSAYDHQDVPFEKVVEIVAKDRDAARTPLFQTMLVLANTPESAKLVVGSVELSSEPFANQISKFEITLFIAETPKGLSVNLEYATELYSAVMAESMAGHFTTLIHSVVENPQQQVGLLRILPPEEHSLLETFNDASVSYPAEKSIVDFFEEQVLKTPDNIAVVAEGTQMTFFQLNEKANQIAHYLQSRGAEPGTPVALYMERSVLLMAGLLGILKSGAAYLPIDTDFPASRIRFMLEDANAKLMVSSSSIAPEEIEGIEIIEADDFSISLLSKSNPATKPAASDLAYIIYTSGSTGRPKGTMIEHRSLADYYFGLDKFTEIGQCKSFALVSTIATDLGNTVIFASLLSGGALHVFSKTSVSNAAYLQRYFEQQQIDCVKIVPSHWKALSTDDGLLLPQKLIVFGGEALQMEVVEAISASGSACRIINHYGPTETTIGKLLHPVSEDKKYESTIPIGKPFSNTTVYVLSAEMQLCPVGVPGQLYIGGQGVGRGYYNNPELTASRFLPDLYSKNAEAGTTMYATGDLVKWLPDGNILFIGRADEQIKIRGYRVEPGEVETVIRQSGMVNAAAVVASQDKQGNNRLVAYIVLKQTFDKEDVTARLQENLPEYMVPGILVQLNEMPLTANGKVDRKALPGPETETIQGNECVAPRNETEKQLIAIWEDVLELDAMSVHDNFFALGGHSLLAVRLISAIRKVFKKEVPIGDVFDYPTVTELASRLSSISDKVLMPAIQVQARPLHIPLSFSQERLWFIDQLNGSTQYHIPTVLQLNGKLEIAALSGALQQVIRRHEALRTVILENDGENYQEMQNWEGWKLEVENGFIQGKNAEQLQAFIQHLIALPFNLSKDYLVRATLIRLAEEEHLLAVVLHHIASDGYSTSIMVNELTELYNAAVEQRTPSLPILPIQYADYAIWQRNYLQGKEWDKKLSYWKNQLQDVEELQLPTDYSRPPIQSTNGATASIKIDKQLSTDLQAFSQQQGVTIFMTLLAAVKVLLHRYTGQQDVCVGTPIAGRQQQELEGLIGFFINTLALRSQVEGSATFTNLLQQVKTTTLSAYDYQDVPFEKVVEAVVVERDMSRSPLFQVMLILQNTPEVQQLHLGELQVSQRFGTSNHTSAKFDLTFNITESTNDLFITLEYVTDLFAAPTITRMLAHFNELLHSIVKTPALPIAVLSMLSADEKHKLLVSNNNTAADYPKDKTFIDLFEAQAAKTPDAVAVIFEDEQHTYRQLNTKANQLAHYLRNKGIQPEALVPLCIERSPLMMVGLLGIMKAGAAYVPIDPAYPADRIRFMLEDSGASLVVSSSNSSRKINATHQFTIIELDTNQELKNYPGRNLENTALPNHLAYVIYTSGSTGMPKGVVIEHNSVVNLLMSMAGIVQFKAGSGFLAVTTYSFDIAYLELYMPLLFGGRVIITPKEVVTDGLLLAKSITDHQPTHMQATPSAWQILLDSGWENKEGIIMLTGGEAIREDIKEALVQKGTVYNCYGPTETTIWSAIKKLECGKRVSIGKPIANTTILILNDHLQLVPIGVTGEIYIGGTGLARAYYNRPELTEEKFIANPFVAGDSKRLYKTGDLGRLLPDGNIAFLGRIDTQVKVRGYRIELGEIETVLQQSDWVLQAVVEPKKDAQGDVKLVGYIVPNGSFNQPEIIHFLREKLPDYMVPSLWVALESLPLTFNGKINRKALPDPNISALATGNYLAPVTEIEKALTTIWQELLGVNRISINDDFFYLGGHSLLAIRLVASIRKNLQVELTIKNLFYHPTVAMLAAYLEKQHKGLLFPSVEPSVLRPQHIPLSFSQERLWFIDQLGGSLQYHIPAVLRLQGELDKEALSNVLQQIIERHEVLRTVILQHEGINYQFIKDALNWHLPVTDDFAYNQHVEELEKFIKQRISHPFDLSEDYMLRADLIKIEEQNHLFVVTMHHIASDGWSLPIIIREVTELYTAYIQQRPPLLPLLPIQYADFAIWQRNYLKGKVLDTKLQYWKDKLEGVTVLQLPANKPRPLIQSNNGTLANFSIEKELVSQLQSLSQQHGSTLFMTLLAAFKILLHRYSGQQDICVGTPIAGRQQEEVEELVGFFVNTLALRTAVSGEDSFTALLAKVKQTTVEAYEHQEVPFEKVVEAVVKERDMSRSPLFQAVLGLQNTPPIPQLRLGELQLFSVLEASAHATSKFDLSFNITETAKGLNLSVEYATDLFDAERIYQLISHYNILLQSIVATPQKSIGLLAMLSHAEEKKLLTDFNNTASSYPASQTIVDLFEQQVDISPDSKALVYEDTALTYAQLNEKANQLAHYLQSKGVTNGTLVAISMERSTKLIIGILGILKAGGAYVPLDVHYPPERISLMLQDTAAPLILTTTKNLLTLPANGKCELINVDHDWNLICQQQTTNLPHTITSGSLAYVMYTSGSTGKPKGIQVIHRNVVSLVTGVNYVSLASTDVLLSTGSTSFDATTFEYWAMLLQGGKLVLCSESTLLNPQLLRQEIISKKVNLMWFTSSWLNQLIDTDITIFDSLQTILAGGEKLSEHHIAKLRHTYPALEIINGYGPTENTTFSLTHRITEIKQSQSIPIGEPLNNRTAYILDSYQQLVPIGVSGEIYVGGAGVSAGYLNEPQLTAKQFIRSPFDAAGVQTTLYRTGDIGRWTAQGEIEYMGRVDDQVKIRGYRIEPAEIENCLLESGLVSQAVVIVREDVSGSKKLVGYVVSAHLPDKETITSYLHERLPEFMVPAVWVALENLPLTSNGKIDKNLLPEPEVSQLPVKQYEAPKTELEAQFVTIWQDLLEVENVGINDNFFDLGGHSLYAIRLVSLIQKKMRLDISINDVFIYPTIAGLIKNVIDKTQYPSLPVVKIRYLVPVKKSGSKPPLYFVAGGGGTALKMKKFAGLLSPEQPVYVFQPPIGYKEVKDFPDTVEAIAATFIEELLIHNPDGPYDLSGHCLGGIIAFEMARQLQNKGKQIHLLAMFDTIVRRKAEVQPAATLKNLYHIPSAIQQNFARLMLKVSFQTFLLRNHTRQTINYKVNNLRLMRKRMKRKKLNTDDLEFAGLEIFNESSEIYVNACRKYTLIPYDGEIVLFFAAERYYFLDIVRNISYKKIKLDDSTKNLWKEFAADTVIYEIKGEHSDIFNPDHGKDFADLLQKHLDNP